MNTLLASQTATPHPEWCRTHDAEPNVCLGPNIYLDFAANGRQVGMAAWANLGIGYCPEEGVDVYVDLPNMGTAYMTLESAEKFATALLALLATVKRGGVR